MSDSCQIIDSPGVRSRLLSRRRLMGAGLALGAVSLAPVSGLAQATPTADGDAAAFPITITHELGETTIPALPTRIVTTNESEALDCLLALGLKPVLSGFTGGYEIGLSPWAAENGGEEVEFFDVIRGAELDAELIAAATPDLILGTWLDEATYNQLSGIAPTLVIKASDVVTWQDMQRMIGQATGQSEAAEAVIAATEAEIAAQPERLAPYTDQTVAIAYEWFDEFFINGETAPIGRLLSEFGMPVLSPGTAAEGEIDILSLERIDVAAAADIIVSPEFIAAELESQEANPLFQALPAVQNGNYITLSREVAQALYLESALSMRWGVPRLVDAVIDAAEGRGTLLGS